jgi:hypothetical protein
MLEIQEVRQFVGRYCMITCKERSGSETTKALHVHDLAFVPLYGTYLVGDVEDVSLEKVTAIKAL